MAKQVAISYRGARYQIGRGPGCYGIWAAAAPPEQPLERWPDTRDGWAGAWSRFTAIEAPGTIVRVRWPAAVASASTIARAAAILLAVGVASGLAGLFPSYVGGVSLAQQPAELVPHVIYLAAWAASALLILAGRTRPGGSWLRAGALLGTGVSVITFGLFLAEAGQVVAGGAHLFDFGLLLGLVSWLACTAGAVAALRLQPAGAPPAGALGRPRRLAPRAVLALSLSTLAALGTAITFAPSWDSYTLRTAAGTVQSLTAGNSFANPAPVIAGDVAVMAALVVVAVIAALWRPARLGAALLAGAVIPMAAQAISALVQAGQPIPPEQFGISPAQAAQAGLTISSGLTPVFWVYCAFVVALAAVCVFLSVPPRRAPSPVAPGHGPAPAGAWQAPAGAGQQAPADTWQTPATPTG